MRRTKLLTKLLATMSRKSAGAASAAAAASGAPSIGFPKGNSSMESAEEEAGIFFHEYGRRVGGVPRSSLKRKYKGLQGRTAKKQILKIASEKARNEAYVKTKRKIRRIQ